jgi:hypothetical protein
MNKLDKKTVYSYEEDNHHVEGGQINPNSAIMSMFIDGEKSYELSGLLRVLFSLLKEPAFNQLRTNE